ncbi:MAG: hypothetical protein JW820_20805 [Spirochaetales bacterium]|nr:hypothetical protein [Spirochaetales bacterium]
MKHWLAKDLDAHKAKLEERAHEHAVTFTKLHEQRVLVIGEVYGRLRRVHDTLWACVALMGPRKPEIAEATMEASRELCAYFYPNSIWLDSDTSDAVGKIVEKLRSAVDDMTTDMTEVGITSDKESFKSAREIVGSDLPSAMRLLEDRFRKILAVGPKQGQLA